MTSERPFWPGAHMRPFQRKPSLRFAALTWGSRGDVQPFVALGAELVRRGHSAVIAARAPFRSLVEEHGLGFFEMEEDGTDALMSTLANLDDSGLAGLKAFVTWQRSLVGPQLRQFWEASRGADVILSNGAFTAPALDVAEHRGIPIFQAFFDPGFIPTRRYGVFDNRVEDRGPLLNLASTRVKNLVTGLLTRDIQNAWRRERRMPAYLLGERLHPARLSRLPVLAAWTQQLFERPDDWPEWFVQTGRWHTPVEPKIDPRLAEFMRAGPPPLYIGFGSWGVHDRTAVTNALLEAIRVTGDRAILHRNTVDGRSSFPAEVYVDDDLPHDWLFPQAKVVVHHGGAGTAGAVATAGVPSVIIPAFFAQGVWGNAAIQKGVGTMLSRRELRVDSLVAALREANQPRARERARALGERARREGGVSQAADEIELRLREATA